MIEQVLEHIFALQMEFRVIDKDVFADLEGYVAIEDGGFALEALDGLGGVFGGGRVGG